LKPQKICFVGRDNYPVLNPSVASSQIGGESVQQTLLAKELVRSGWDVSTVVIDHGQPDGEVIDGVTVYKTYRPEAGLPGFRFVHPRATAVFKALRRADADVYYQSCAGVLTGYVARHCRKNNRKFVFRVASDADCMPGQQLIGLWRDKKIYEYGLRRADLILAQSYKQVDLLRRNYGLDSVCLNMAVEIPADSTDSARNIDALWVGNIKPLKRPEIVFQLATRLPQCRFVVVGGPSSGYNRYFSEVQRQAQSISNLRFAGPVPYKDISRYFSDAKVFINTSEMEGFPNTFLQSWIHGVPVVSFFDPDGIVVANNLGYAPTDVEQMARVIEELTSDETKRSEIARHAAGFALEHYSPEAVVEEYIGVLAKTFSW
jgi:glycosyltransferase involved in cell wall biosynthesis